MFSFLSLLIAFRFGTVPTLASPTVSVRAESRAVAEQSALSPAALLERGPLLGAPQAPQWPGRASGSGVAPVFQQHRPEEWVANVAQGFSLGDHKVTQAAMWIASFPLQVDLSPKHVYVSVRIKGP